MSDTINKEPSKRLVHLDLLRLLAIFFVIFNHTSDRGYTLFVEKSDSILCFFYMMFSILCKIAVPIFFMISGALLLSKQETYKQLFFKRVLRMIVVLILISVPYYFWLHRFSGLGIKNFFTLIYSDCASTSLWYLYSYVGLLLMLPFLRNMVRGMKQSDFLYLITGHLILFGLLPCLEYCLWGGNITLNNAFSSVIFVTQNIFYALIGYYLEHTLDKRYYNKKTVVWSIVFSIVAIVVTCFMTWLQMVKGVSNIEQIEMFFECFICIPAMTLYFLVKLGSSKIGCPKLKKILSVLGSSVFGVYLIEKILRAVTNIVYDLMLPICGSFAAALIWCLVTGVLSVVIIISLKRIPYVKTIINKFI